MQFIDNGPDIPDELIVARDQDNVIFICGAGVSHHLAKLPLFRDLVKGIYKKLGESPQDTEAITYKKGKYDETLWSLERRIGGGRKGRGIIIEKIHKILKEPYYDISQDFLKYHETLLELSERPVLTTNFDTLFEKSSNKIKSHYGPAFPDLADGEEFKGVIHLHGRLKDEECNLENTPLILTLRDFAEAYMREGWLARFLYKIARKFNIVFIGYSADDYFLKLLLSSIAEDQDIFPDIKNVYAFTEEGHKSFWKMFDIIPIIFNDNDYDSLYKSLKKWKEYIDNPDKKRELIQQIFSGDSKGV